MSNKFSNGQIFVILDDDEITQQMLNYSTSKTKDDMPSKISGGITKRIVETTEPVNDGYSNSQWYAANEILTAWEAIVED